MATEDPSGEHEGDYINRKSFHSINVQMICDADCLVSNLESKWPGSVHDSRVFRASPIYELLSQGTFSGVLLGDKGYACESFLLTPLADPQTPSQQAYNHAHNKTRAHIEMTFGLLKSRFQCLHHLRVSPDRACDVIAACAVVLQYVPCMKRTVSVAGTESVTDRVSYLDPLHHWRGSRECQLLRWGHILACLIMTVPVHLFIKLHQELLFSGCDNVTAAEQQLVTYET
ncbi:putative nuclease HARBI1 [Merluccius polli]|uniref:Nuclease HARBI1 n=1 Tax=Merluccius polli TaxID=89951 RepID=A0AA47P4S8_MERPO|nr:putative nuclease HARBI1 [Merluccius polli]